MNRGVDAACRGGSGRRTFATTTDENAGIMENGAQTNAGQATNRLVSAKRPCAELLLPPTGLLSQSTWFTLFQYRPTGQNRSHPCALERPFRAHASLRLVNRGGKWQVVAGRIAWLIAGGVVVVADRSTDWRCWGGMGAPSCRWFKSLPGLVCRCGPVSSGWSGKR